MTTSALLGVSLLAGGASATTSPGETLQTNPGRAPLEQVDMAKTYVNPVSLPGVEVLTRPSQMAATDENVAQVTPRLREILDKPEWLPADGRGAVGQSKSGFAVVSENAFRTAADFSAVNVDGTIYLYASGALNNPDNSRVAWSTTDYVNWEPHQMNIGVTAPSVVQVEDKFYLAGNNTPIYVADSPTGPWTELGRPTFANGTQISAGDVQFFLDDDGRLYMNYNIGSPILGVELDPSDPTKVLSDAPSTLWNFDSMQEWQHFGDNKQAFTHGYVEAGQLFKVGDTYYMSVASGGTEHTTYATGVVSSDSPLEGFAPAEDQVNPIGYGPQSNYPSGLYPNAGHGSFVVDDDGNIVFFYTYVIAYETGFERRLGIDVCEQAPSGALSCELTNTPQLAPGEDVDGQRDVGLYNLSTLTSAYWASSYAPGRTPYYAADRTMSTWWQPEEDDEAPSYITGFAGPYYISAAQISWKEIGQTFTKNNAVQYTLEYRDLDTNSWKPLVDHTGNTTAITDDYVTFDRVFTTAVRLKLLGTTEDVTVGISELDIFGEDYSLAEEKGIIAVDAATQFGRLQATIDTLIEQGQVSGPVQRRLVQQIDLAASQYEAGRATQAERTLDRVLTTLERTSQRDTITASARTQLQTAISRIKGLLE